MSTLFWGYAMIEESLEAHSYFGVGTGCWLATKEKEIEIASMSRGPPTHVYLQLVYWLAPLVSQLLIS